MSSNITNSTVSVSEFSKIYKARETLIDLLNEQQYDVSEYQNISKGELHSMINNKQLDMLIEKKDKSSKM